MRKETTEDRAVWVTWMGLKVSKHSGRPFKSTFKVNTVRGTTIHPTSGRLCFLFEEDETYVECRTCRIDRGTAP